MELILNLEPAVKSRSGIGHYAWHLWRELALLPQIEQIRPFSGKHWLSGQAAHLQEQMSDSWRLRLMRKLPLAYPARQWLRELRFRQHSDRLRQHARQLYHETNFILLPYAGPQIATLHDLSWLRYPETHPMHRIRWLERALPATLQAASRLITVSQYIKDEMVRTLGVDEQQIAVVHNGVADDFRPPPAPVLHRALQRHGLQAGQYLLTVCTFEPRKNLARLLSAYATLPLALRQQMPLVHVGGEGWCNEALHAKAEQLAAEGSFRRLGYVPTADLPALYAGCRGFLYPSLYEGFGLPVLEAMACGVPVLSSRDSAMAEISAGAALLIEPLELDALRQGMLDLLDGAISPQQIKLGQEQASQLSWQKTARSTLEVYQSVLA